MSIRGQNHPKICQKDTIPMRMILEWPVNSLIEAKITNVFKFLAGNEHEISSDHVQLSMNRFVVANSRAWNL